MADAWFSSWLYDRCCPFLPCTVLRFLELPATTGEVAERQSLARTQGRNLDRSFTVPRADLGSEGHRPQNRAATTADTPQHECSRSAWLEERAATRVPSVAHGASLQLAHGASSTSVAPTQEPAKPPRGRQCEHPSRGDQPQNWRATSHGPAGQAPNNMSAEKTSSDVRATFRSTCTSNAPRARVGYWRR